MRPWPTWKLLTILGVLSLVSGLSVVGIDAIYGFWGKTPGTIAMIGVSMISAPWLALAGHLRHQLKMQQQRDALALAHDPRGVVRSLTETGAHRVVQAIHEEHPMRSLGRGGAGDEGGRQ